MKNYFENLVKKESKEINVLGVVVLVILLLMIVAFYFGTTNILSLKSDLASTTGRINNLEAALATTTLTSQELAARLKDQQDKSNDFEDTISDISGTVDTLEKLSKTDRELLQKYSRVYFLSDNYVPSRLKEIDSQYVYDKTKSLEFHALVLPYLQDMLDSAMNKDLEIKVVSAYRSFGTQSGLKASYLTTYGSGANQFSADQGYSEHQLGTAVDLTVVGQDPALDIKFEQSPAYVWMTKNAYRYGFILSYPKNNAYYQYEPWHWRFVGVKLATYLHKNDLNFSDMDQRQIDEYLVNIFD